MYVLLEYLNNCSVLRSYTIRTVYTGPMGFRQKRLYGILAIMINGIKLFVSVEL